jgi:hypothetical protein
LTRIAPTVTAAVKRGAGPNSPRLTAEVSIVSTQPAPMSKSACRLEVGSAIRCSRRTPRRMSARVAAMATPDTSRGTANTQPSVMGARASSSERAIMEASKSNRRTAAGTPVAFSWPHAEEHAKRASRSMRPPSSFETAP